ncbi:MAG: lipid A deacylase LpxR family protein, partial [Alphaproteobacteria bacterium]|nr:lipid A deacylase LpxR family protein [Alphaproteobacteria bacterium]
GKGGRAGLRERTGEGAGETRARGRAGAALRTRHRPGGPGLAPVLALGLALAASAAPAARADSLALLVENDVFTAASTDRNFTNGLKATYSWTVGSTPGRARALGRRLFGDPDARIFASLSLGQSIFTPADIEAEERLPDQHPYAGWLYLGGALTADRTSHADILSLEVGIVGPSALGEEVQSGFHELINGVDPKGWDNQLKDEPGFLVSYDRIWRARQLFGANTERRLFGLDLDLTPSVGLSLGTISTEARAGAAFRAGSDVDGDFGPPRVRPSPAAASVLEPSEAFRWYVFAGAYGRAVAYSVFLDGNAFRDSPVELERRPLVGELQGGLVLEWQRIALSYTMVLRTEEFETQEDEHQFGAISLTVGF